MQFNVAQLLKEPTGAVRRYELAEDLSELDPELQFLGPLVGTVTLLRTNSGVLVTGELSAPVQVTCNLCLSPIAQPVRFELEEMFHPTTEVATGRPLRDDEYEGGPEDLEDAALLIDEKHILDASEVIRQNLWLALPMYPGCNWIGLGDCPNLGRVPMLDDVRLIRAGESIDNDAEEIDPRWSALRKLQVGDENEGTSG